MPSKEGQETRFAAAHDRAEFETKDPVSMRIASQELKVPAPAEPAVLRSRRQSPVNSTSGIIGVYAGSVKDQDRIAGNGKCAAQVGSIAGDYAVFGSHQNPVFHRNTAAFGSQAISQQEIFEQQVAVMIFD